LAASEGAGEGAAIDVFEGAAHGKAEGKAGDGDGRFVKLFFYVEGGGIAFEGGVEGDDHFPDLEGRNSLKEMGEAEPLHGSAVERREEAAEDVIESFVEMGLFDGKDVLRRGNDA
jgi:hypothetical protein